MIHQTVFTAYGIDRRLAEVTPLKNGLINSTWKIKDKGQYFILQKINTGVFKNPDAIASNIRLIADYLHSYEPGYLFVAPLQTGKGEEMVQIDNHTYFRLFKFVKNSHTISTVERPEQAFEAATQFGKFTKLLSQFPVEKLQTTLPDFHNLTLRYQQFSGALRSANPERLHQSGALIETIEANKQIVNTFQNIRQNPSFKLRVTHHDTKISNVLFDNRDKGLCIIDLDTLMPGYFISDVGDMMRTYLSPVNEEESDFSKIEIRENYFKSIWDGYMVYMNNELNEEEKRHFIYSGKFMIYMQALRFLTDHLNDDRYYGARYEGQNFVRAANQIVLLQRLIEKEKTLQKIIEL